MTGRLVTLEGIDACGKTTATAHVVEGLRAKGLDAILVNKKQLEGYPNSYLTFFMENLGRSLWGAQSDDPVSDIPEASWMCLHAIWYRTMQDHLLTGLLARHPYVVMDGWYYKFLARHRANGYDDQDFCSKVFRDIRPADFVFFLDAKPETCWTRRSGFRQSELGVHGNVTDGTPESRFVQYQTKVRDSYQKMASGTGWRRVSAEEASTLVVAEIVETLLGADRFVAGSNGGVGRSLASPPSAI